MQPTAARLLLAKDSPPHSPAPGRPLHPTPQVVLYVGGFTKPDLQLFSAAGRPLGRVLWDSRARVVAAGWTRAEQLLVVDDAAQVGRLRWRARATPFLQPAFTHPANAAVCCVLLCAAGH